jgi:hypothetical protein
MFLSTVLGTDLCGVLRVLGLVLLVVEAESLEFAERHLGGKGRGRHDKEEEG